MRLIKPPALELYSFLFSMPLIDVALNLVLYKDRVWHDASIWLISFPLIFVMGAMSWYGHVIYSDKVERKFPGLNQSPQRIVRKALVLFLVMLPSVAVIFFVYDYFSILGYQLEETDVLKGVLLGFSVNLVFETLYESDFVLTRLRESVTERKRL